MYAKILATSEMEVKYKPKVLVSQVWNAIIISMYREHLLSIDHVQRLLYHQVPSEQDGKRMLRAPMFFISQDDKVRFTFFAVQYEKAHWLLDLFFRLKLSSSRLDPKQLDESLSSLNLSRLRFQNHCLSMRCQPSPS